MVDNVPEGFTFKEERRSVVNFGIGGEFYLNDKWNLYGSISTDFSPFKANANIFDLTGDEEDDTNFDSNFYHFGLGVDLKMKRVKLIVGSTFSSGSYKFDQPLNFPDPNLDLIANDDPSKITTTRWQFIIGIEVPIFGYDLEFK
jgi:hypothetical protein